MTNIVALLDVLVVFVVLDILVFSVFFVVFAVLVVLVAPVIFVVFFVPVVVLLRGTAVLCCFHGTSCSCQLFSRSKGRCCRNKALGTE